MSPPDVSPKVKPNFSFQRDATHFRLSFQVMLIIAIEIHYHQTIGVPFHCSPGVYTRRTFSLYHSLAVCQKNLKKRLKSAKSLQNIFSFLSIITAFSSLSEKLIKSSREVCFEGIKFGVHVIGTEHKYEHHWNRD